MTQTEIDDRKNGYFICEECGTRQHVGVDQRKNATCVECGEPLDTSEEGDGAPGPEPRTSYPPDKSETDKPPTQFPSLAAGALPLLSMSEINALTQRFERLPALRRSYGYDGNDFHSKDCRRALNRYLTAQQYAKDSTNKQDAHREAKQQ